jgi:hypothetical protein
MLKKWKPISFKLSNAELSQIKSMPKPAGKHFEATQTFKWIKISKPRNRAADYKLDLVQHQHIDVANEGKHDDDKWWWTNIAERVPRLNCVTVRSPGVQTQLKLEITDAGASTAANLLLQVWIKACTDKTELSLVPPRALMGRAAASERNLGLNLKWTPPKPGQQLPVGKSILHPQVGITVKLKTAGSRAQHCSRSESCVTESSVPGPGPGIKPFQTKSWPLSW